MFTRTVKMIILALGLLVVISTHELPLPMCPGTGDPSCQR